MNFKSIYGHGFVRLAACSPRLALADPVSNVKAILGQVSECHKSGLAVAVFPELSLTGYAIDDLLQQDAINKTMLLAVEKLVAGSSALMPLLLVGGGPLLHDDGVFNCALAIKRGRLPGVVPKIHLANYQEFFERRHFSSGAGIHGQTIKIGCHTAPLGRDMLFAANPKTLIQHLICWVAFLALTAWGGANRGAWPEGVPEEVRRAYEPEEIRKWLQVFLENFFPV